MKENKIKPMATIAVEDLITVVCETFAEMLRDGSFKDYDPLSSSVQGWYMVRKTDDERRAISEKILDRIKDDIKKTKEDKAI